MGAIGNWARKFLGRKSEPALINEIIESAPAEGTTCTWPTRDAWDKAVASSKGKGIDPKKLEKCGKPAVVAVRTIFTNCPDQTESYCEECRPRKWEPEQT